MSQRPPPLELPHRAAWRAWLAAHHTQPDGVWLVLGRKAATAPHLRYDEAVEEALCFGWIDSLPGTLDATRTLLYFAPRKAGSGWAATNKARIERLVAAGLMTAAGLAKIDAAKRDGSWTRIDGAIALVVPDDLADALARNHGAAAHFDAFPPSARRALLEWIATAKRPETRARRIQETAEKAARGERANVWTPKQTS